MKTLSLAALCAVLLLSCGIAQADEYSFTFSADPVGCTWTGSCSTPTVGSGMFTTGAPEVSPDYGVSFAVSPVLSIAGQFNGFAMTLATPTGGIAGALMVQGPASAPFEGVYWGEPIMFTAGGQTFGLFNSDGVIPPGTQNFVQQEVNGVWQPNVAAVSLSIVNVPESGTLGMALASLAAMLILIFRNKARPHNAGVAA